MTGRAGRCEPIGCLLWIVGFSGSRRLRCGKPVAGLGRLPDRGPLNRQIDEIRRRG